MIQNTYHKIHKLVLPIFISMALVGLVSCENWLDVNNNPNAPDEVDYSYMLPSGISSVAYVIGGRYQVLGALWSQHWTQSPGASQYSGIDSYDINSSSFDDRQFGELYAGGLKDLEHVRQEALKDKEWNFYLVATLVQAFGYQVLVDLYNKVPFTEALSGEEGMVEPVYDDGMLIYDSLIARIDEALTYDYDDEDLRELGDFDIVFNGDINKWIEFANTLKLKLFLRQVNARPEITKAGIEQMLNDEVDFLFADASLNLFRDESGRRNPVYDTDIIGYGGNPNLILSYTLYSFMSENFDFNRLDYTFYKPARGGGHKALAQGDYYAPDEPSGTNSSAYSKPALFAETPIYLFSATEAKLLYSEAIVRYQNEDFDKAKERYEGAIEDAYVRILGNSQQVKNIAAGFYNGVYAFPSEGSVLEEYIKSIAIQKWLNLAGIQSLETFLEQNRTGYPELSEVTADDNNYEPGEFTISVNNVTSNRFPKRLIFPESEYTTNKNTPDKKEVWEPVWWDVE